MSILQMEERLRVLRRLLVSCCGSSKDMEIRNYYSSKVSEVKQQIKEANKLWQSK